MKMHGLLISLLYFILGSYYVTFTMAYTCPSVQNGVQLIPVILQSKIDCSTDDIREEKRIADQLESTFNQTLSTCESNLELTVVSGCAPNSFSHLNMLQPGYQLSGDEICILNRTTERPNIAGFLVEDISVVNLYEPILTPEQFIVTTSPTVPDSRAVSMSADPKTIIEAMIKFIADLRWDIVTLFVTREYEQTYGSVELVNLLKNSHICLHNPSSYVITRGQSRPALTNATKGVVFLGDQETGRRVYEEWSRMEEIWVVSTDPQLITHLRNQPSVAVSIPRRDLANSSTTSVREQLLIESMEKILEGRGRDCEFDGLGLQTQRVEFYLVRNGQIKSISNGNDTESRSNMAELERSSLCKSSYCMRKCFDQLQENFEDQYIFIPGKYILLITMPIHAGTSTSTPWECSMTDFKPKQNFAQRSVMAEFALHDINRQYSSNSQSQVNTFGMLFLDTCFSGVRAGSLISEIFQGKRKIETADKSIELDPGTIVLIISDCSSNVALQVYNYADALNILQIGPGAASLLLDNRTIYPNFIRVNPSDAIVVQTMVKAFDKIRHSGGNHIDKATILYSDNVYGKNSQYLKELLEINGVTVVSYTALSTDEATNLQILQNMKSRDDCFVFIYGDSNDWELLLDKLQSENELRTWWVQEARAFFFDTSFGNIIDLLDKYGSLIRGSLTTYSSPRFSRSRQSFTRFYQNLENPPTFKTSNPWLARMWAIENTCKIPGIFECQADYSRFGNCGALCEPGNYADLIQENEIYGSYMMKAMYTAERGLFHFASFHNNCDIKTATCEILYQHNSEKLKQLKRIMLNIDDVEVDSFGTTERIFDSSSQNGLAHIEILSMECLEATCSQQTFTTIFNNTSDQILRTPLFYRNSGAGNKIETIDAKHIDDVTSSSTDLTSTPTPTLPTWNIVLLCIFALISLGMVILVSLLYSNSRRRTRRSVNSPSPSNLYDVPQPGGIPIERYPPGQLNPAFQDGLN